MAVRARPHDVKPFAVEQAVEVEQAPRGAGWLHEPLFEGARIVASVTRGIVRLHGDDGVDRTREHPAIARALAALAEDATLDGEIVEGNGREAYVVYDLIARGRRSLRRATLARRKEALRALIGAMGDDAVRFADHVEGDPRPLLEQGCARGLAGVVSKRAASTYRSGPHDDWRVTRCGRAVERATEAAARPEPRARSKDARVDVAGVSVSRPEHLVYPKLGIRKVDLARYYDAIADWMLPHVAGRPLTLVRCAGSVGALAEHGRHAASCVYMRHAKAWGPAALRRITIREQTKIGEYLVCDSREALVSLAQMDIVEVHTWNSTAAHLEQPNRVVIDLDPDEGVPRARLIDAARLVREAFARFDLESWLKTTGGKGLHVVVPFAPRFSWDACFAFSRAIALAIEKSAPDAFTIKVGKAERRGKILLDYLRNNRGSTSVAAFSTRARPTATVSTPIRWNEIDELGSDAFDVVSVRKRLTRLRVDPWRGYFESRQSLTPSMLRALGVSER